MEIQDFKRWQWALIGLVGGLVLGLAYRTVYTDFDPGLPTVRQPELLAPLMVQQDFATGRPVVDDVVVYPLSDSGAKAQLLTFRIRQVYHFRDPQSGEFFTRSRWEPRQAWAEVPFDPAGAPGNTLGDHLAELEAQGLVPGAEFRTAWWRAPVPGTLVFAAGGLLLMGGIWPSLLAVLVGAGFSSRKLKETYDLSRFRSEPEAEQAGKTGVTAQDLDDLERLNASLEQSTGNGTPTGDEGTAHLGSAGAAPKRVLAADEPPGTAVPLDEEPRDFEGEWYPVARKARREA